MERAVRLNDGRQIPVIGLGLFRSEGENEAENAIRYAYEAGYRLFDTASYYHNEEAVGRGLQMLHVPREGLFVTTKIWTDEQKSGDVEGALDRSLKKLQLDYVDMYMIHWPVRECFDRVWEEMARLKETGKVKSVGVCNCSVSYIKRIMEISGVLPAVNQIECHPAYFEKDTVDFCQKNQIVVEAYAPLGRCKYLDHPTLVRLAEKYGRSEAQIMLRWELQKGLVVIPKSVKQHRIASNADIFHFSLAPEDMEAVDQMNEFRRVIDLDPKTMDI